MSIIKAVKKGDESQNVTMVQPDKDTKETVQDLKKRGYIKIHDAETGEFYS